MSKRAFINNLRKRFAGIAVLSLLCYTCVVCLDPVEDVSHFGRAVWQTENGLPQNSVHSIVQTRDGFIWIATEEGLARFDGINFAVFNKQNTPQFNSNYVRSLLEDRQGALWISTTA